MLNNSNQRADDYTTMNVHVAPVCNQVERSNVAEAIERQQRKGNFCPYIFCVCAVVCCFIWFVIIIRGYITADILLEFIALWFVYAVIMIGKPLLVDRYCLNFDYMYYQSKLEAIFRPLVRS